MASNGKCRALWDVNYERDGMRADETLIIVASNAGAATRKALTFLRQRGERKVRIVEVKDCGIIDVF